MTSTPNWLRYFKLYVGDGAGKSEALDFSDFRVTFHISQNVLRKPCTATVRIYNVAPQTANKIKKLGQPVIIEAGYKENHGRIFEGRLVWKAYGRETPTETYLELVATAGGVGNGYAVTSVSIPAGASDDEVLSHVKKDYSAKDVKNVQTPKTREIALPRGRVYFDATRNVLNEIAKNNNWQWGYTENGVVAMPINGALPQEAIVLTGQTGLEGMPTMTLNGLQVKARLNPKLKLGGTILIDNSMIQAQTYSTELGAEIKDNAAADGSMLGKNGLYKILSREHSGDTHGGDWSTTLICEGVGANITPDSMNTSSLMYLQN